MITASFRDCVSGCTELQVQGVTAESVAALSVDGCCKARLHRLHLKTHILIK